MTANPAALLRSLQSAVSRNDRIRWEIQVSFLPGDPMLICAR
jgi:hypothetical protein